MTARLRKPRITCPHCGSVYVLEREGDPLERDEGGGEAALSSPFHVMPPRSHDWYAMFFRLRAKPEERPWRVRAPGGDRVVHRTAFTMLQNARSNIGEQCDSGERPSDAERAAMVSIAVGSPAFDAWRRTLEAEGYRGFGSDGAEWVRVPSEWPDALPGGAGSEATGARGSADEVGRPNGGQESGSDGHG